MYNQACVKDIEPGAGDLHFSEYTIHDYNNMDILQI